MFLEGLLKQKGILKLMLAIALICGISPVNSIAMPIDSQIIVHSNTAQSIYLEKVQDFLNKDIVQNRLSKLGLNPEDAQLYVSQLDQAQLEKLANKVDSVEAAGNTGIVVLLIVLLIAMCVLYFADYGLKLEPRNKSKK